MSRERSRAGAAVVAALAMMMMTSPASAQEENQETESTTETTTAVSAESPETTETAETTTAAPAETAETITAEASPSVLAQRGDRGTRVRDLQARLNAAGFSAGTVDGIYGSKTQAAVSKFQSAASLSATGVYDQATADALNAYKPSTSSNGSAAMSVRQAQQRLTDLGFNPGPVDGIYGSKTRAGLEAFQRAAGISVTGQIDASTVSAMGTYNGSGGGSSSSGSASQQSVASYQRALASGPFDPGPIDGAYGTKTKQAIWALEKLAGLPMDGKWGQAEADALAKVKNGSIGAAKNSYSSRWVEVDLSQQLMMVYDPGRTSPVLVSHVSTGSGKAWSNDTASGSSITPTGKFEILWRVDGWRESSLDIGRLYNPLYFTWGGIAFHGATSVPDYPASHGCVRVPMHIASYLPGMLSNGAHVVVRR